MPYAGANTVTAGLQGFLKTRYAQNVVNTIPEAMVLTDDAPFRESQRIGEQFHQAVIIALEQGFTYHAANQDAFDLEAAQAGAIESALVNASQGVLRAAVSYEGLAKAIRGGATAYGSSLSRLLENMVLSSRKRLEIELWHGQSADGIGAISDVSPAPAYEISAASWAPGNWVGMEGARVEVHIAGFTTERDTATTFRISDVDIGTRRVTLDGSVTGAVNTDVITFGTMIEDTTPAYNSMLGLIAIAASPATLFNIATTNSIWSPESYAVSGVYSFSHAQRQAVTSVVKGLMRGATLYVASEIWADLLTEQSALRRYGGDFDGRVRLINGGRAIEFWSSTGRLEIKPSIYCPVGTTFVCPTGGLSRVGTTDVTFTVPGLGEQNVHIVDAQAGISFRTYYGQALFTPEPGQITRGTGVVAST